jgi:hypothetical protein
MRGPLVKSTNPSSSRGGFKYWEEGGRGKGGGKGKGGKGGVKGGKGRGDGGRGKGGGRGGRGGGNGVMEDAAPPRHPPRCTTIEYHFDAQGWRVRLLPRNCPGTEYLRNIVDQINQQFQAQVEQIPLHIQDPLNPELRAAQIQGIFSAECSPKPDWFNPNNASYQSGQFLDINNTGNVLQLHDMVLPLLSDGGNLEYNIHYHFHPARGRTTSLKNCVTLTIRFVVPPRVPVNRERW